jgi:cytochrome P450
VSPTLTRVSGTAFERDSPAVTNVADVTDEDLFSYDPTEAFAAVAGDVVDPYPELKDERVNNPIKRVTFAEMGGVEIDPNMPRDEGSDDAVYTVFSYDLVRQVLSEDDRFSSKGYEMVMGPVMGHTILEMDAPEHPRMRALVAKAFRPRVVQMWSETLIGSVVDDLIDRIQDKGSADLVRALTFPFPVRVIAKILGLPQEDWAKFQIWSIELIGVTTDWNKAIAASASLKEYFGRVVDERRANPQADLISELVQAEVDGDRLTNDEIYAFLCLLLPAGAETTFRSSGNLIYAMLTHEGVYERVRDDRSLLPKLIDEALRWEPPLLFIMRQAKVDTELHGMKIPAGATIGVSLGAANRDDSRWDNPDVFDMDREFKQYASFGAGPHLCLGTHLAKLETQVAINAILDRLPNLRLDPAEMAKGEDAPHIHGMTFRSPTSLPVLWDV